MKSAKKRPLVLRSQDYDAMLDRVVRLIDESRRTSARTVNAVMTATYWLIGRHIVEFEQQGKTRAEYGEELLQRLAQDLSAKFGRGFSYPNVNKFRQFYLAFPSANILSTPSIESTESIVSTASIELRRRKGQTPSDQLAVRDFSARFPLPWSAYVRLLSVTSEQARKFYETEALRGGWSVRQLDRQINSLFYERIALSRNKAKMLTKGAAAKTEDAVAPEEEIKDPYVLEFLGLKDEYSESDIEEALILHLERFLLELGGDFTFVVTSYEVPSTETYTSASRTICGIESRNTTMGEFIQQLPGAHWSWFTTRRVGAKRTPSNERNISRARGGNVTSRIASPIISGGKHVSELRARKLDTRRRKSARRSHSLHAKRRSRRSLRARRIAQQNSRH